MQEPAAESWAERWRQHCQQEPQSFAPLGRTPSVRKRVGEWEQQRIAELCCPELPVAERAVALRCIVELRQCTLRQAAVFFQVEPQVIVISLSLLQISAEAENAVAPPVASSRKSRTRAA